MGVLLKKLLRDLKEAKGQLIAILVVIIIGVMFYTGINATFKNLSQASSKYYEDYRFADIWASVHNAPESVLRKLESLPFVDMLIGRITKDVKINISEENATIRLMTLPDFRSEIVNDIVIKSGEYFSTHEANECLVEEEFLKAHDLKIGNYISPIINGNEVKLKVVGSVKSPEFVYIIKDSSDFLNDNKKFGIVYLKKSFAQTILGLNGSVNDIAMTVKSGTDIEAAKDDVAKILKPFGVTSVIDREEQISNRMLSEEIKGQQSMGKAFPVIFFIVASIIIYIMMSRIVENQRTQIGVLKAFGYSNAHIIAHYMSYSVLFGIVGSAIGSVLGMFLGIAMMQVMNAYFHLPLSDMKIYPELAIPASLIILFFCMLAGYNACKLVLTINPAQAMRPKSPKIAKKTIIERFTFLWNRFNYSWKMTIRNLFRYKKRVTLTTVGIIVSTIVLFIGFGVQKSMDFLIERQYKDILNYDLKINFSGLLSIDEINILRSIAHIERVEPLVEVGVEVSNGWRKKDVGLIALTDSSELYRVLDKDANPVSLPKKGIMLPEKLAKTLGVETGGSITLKPYLPNKSEKEVVVSGFVEQYFGLNVYGNIDNVSYLLGEGKVFNGAVVKIEDGIYQQQVRDTLNEIPFISSVYSKEDAKQNFDNIMGMMDSFIAVIIILSGVLCIAVVYNITTINIFERQKELATLKVLGLQDKELREVVFGENYIITFLGIALGLPLGNQLNNYLFKTVYESDIYTIPSVQSADTYIITVILMLVFTAMANIVVRRKIKKLNIVDVLKSNE